MMSQFGLFDFSDRLAALSAFGDPLERLVNVVDFERCFAPFWCQALIPPVALTGDVRLMTRF